MFSKIAALLISMLKTTTFFSTDTKKTLKTYSNSNILIPKAKLDFLRLKQAFIEAFIFYYFEPKRYIRIEIHASGYIIGGILS